MAYTYRLIKGSALSWAELDTNFETMDQQYTDTLDASLIALGAANFKGNWSSLTGPLNKPASVRHSSKYWVLLNNLADVTTSTPGVSADWSEINAGNVVGPVSATNNAVALFDGTTGKLIKDSTKTLPSGTVVGTTDTQTLTNKTLTAPVVSELNGGQLAGMRNKSINGKMDIAQRGASFAIGAAYNLDQWGVYVASTVVGTVTQQADAPSTNEFQNSLRVTVSTADASIAAGDYGFIRQIIEGFNARDLIGKTFTISFWARSSKTGIHCLSLRNGGADRSYIAEYTISAANTWEFKTITISGGLITAGTWNWTNGSGLQMTWMLAAGTTYHTTANAWQTGNFLSTVNQVNCLDTIGNIFAITGVQVEVGTTATPFEHRPYGVELAMCQRYYFRLSASAIGNRFAASWNASTTAANVTVTLPVLMRTSPATMEQSGTAAHYRVAHAATTTACSAVPTLTSASPTIAVVGATVASGLTAGQGSALEAANTSAYLGFSAEL